MFMQDEERPTAKTGASRQLANLRAELRTGMWMGAIGVFIVAGVIILDRLLPC